MGPVTTGGAAAGSHDDADQVATAALKGPALVYRDEGGAVQFVVLEGLSSLTVGRGAGCDVHLSWDPAISRVHAQLDRVGRDWTLVDDGLSRNGTFVNGDRLAGRRRLRDGDTFVVGGTSISYRTYGAAKGQVSQETRVGEDVARLSTLSTTQRQVLVALCRPYRDGAPYATPATNQQIAAELFLSVDAVKTHLRTLFQKFHVESLPQNQKRAKLVERAMSLGVVSRREL